MPLAQGDRLGPFEILAKIGAGGMGEVYKARDTRLDRIVALKTSKQQFTERFEREARAVAQLNHPNICTLHDIGPDYLVMEFVEGAPLKGPLPTDEVLRIAHQITAALSEAHEKHITHRDLKPANVMLKPDGQVKVLDFGLAKLAPPPRTDLDPENSPTLTMSMTDAGMVVGTAAYMAPEQAKGSHLDKRADIWSFGVLLYELLTGKRPFQGADLAEILASVIKEQPDYEPVPQEFRRLIKKCLEKDPAKRLRDIGDVWELLEAPVPAPAAIATQPSKLPWAIAAALALTAALALWAPWRTPEPPPDLARLEVTLPGAAANTAIELSPDGRMLSYVVPENNRNVLWVRPIGSTESQRLVGTEGYSGTWFWSHDSRFLAFALDNKLRKVEVSTGVASVIADGVQSVRGGSWRPDGTLLVGGPDGIRKVSLSGGAPVQLTRTDPAKQDDLNPRYLPDGQHFVFMRNSGTAGQVMVGSVDDPPEKQPTDALITNNGGNAQNRIYFFPASHGKSAQLLFRRDGVVLSQAFDPDTRTLSGEPVPLTTGQVGYFTAAAGMLVFQENSGSGQSQLTILDRSGKTISTLGESFPQYELNVSHDSTRVAVNRDGAIRILEFARPVAPKLSTVASAGVPVWSLDDTQVAFTNRSNVLEVLHRASNGTNAETSFLKTRAYVQDWSRDFVLYTQLNQGGTLPDLFYAPMQNGSPGKPVPYLNSPAQEVQGKFSPDGRWVVYTSDESGERQVYVASFPDPTKQKVTISTSGGAQPRWSRGGDELFYFAPDNTLMSVRYSAPASAFKVETPVPLFKADVKRDAGSNTWGTAWDVLPGGRFLVNIGQQQSGPTPVSIVLNWKSALK